MPPASISRRLSPKPSRAASGGLAPPSRLRMRMIVTSSRISPKLSNTNGTRRRVIPVVQTAAATLPSAQRPRQPSPRASDPGSRADTLVRRRAICSRARRHAGIRLKSSIRPPPIGRRAAPGRRSPSWRRWPPTGRRSWGQSNPDTQAAAEALREWKSQPPAVVTCSITVAGRAGSYTFPVTSGERPWPPPSRSWCLRPRSGLAGMWPGWLRAGAEERVDAGRAGRGGQPGRDAVTAAPRRLGRRRVRDDVRHYVINRLGDWNGVSGGRNTA